MSENRDETGQFTASADHLYGEAYLNHQAGYTTKPEEPTEKGPEEPQELAEQIAEARGHDPEPEPVLGLTDPDDDRPKEALTHQQFTESLAEHRIAHEANVERRANEEMASYADNLRAYISGADTAEQAAQKAEAANPQAPVVEAAPSPEVQAMIETGVERDVAEALAKPQVRAAVEAELAKAESVKGEYAQALQAGQQMLQATVAALAPQLDGVPLELWPQAIQTLAQVDPVRANLVADTLQKWGAIQQAQAQQEQQRAHTAHQQFEATVTAEDARLTEMFGGDKAVADAATDATLSYLAEQGIPRQQMLEVFKANPVLSTAEARQLVWKAKQYDNIQQAKVTAAARPAPQVQRPGVPASSAERSASALNDRTARARSRIDSGKGDAHDIASLIGSLRRA
jgi:hypothetical protein